MIMNFRVSEEETWVLTYTDLFLSSLIALISILRRPMFQGCRWATCDDFYERRRIVMMIMKLYRSDKLKIRGLRR